MPRFFLPPDACRGDVVTLSAADSHHAVRVLRLGAGDAVQILDGVGGSLDGVIEAAGRAAVTVRITARQQAAAEPFHVTLAPALLKGRAMDAVFQKATELGVQAIRPLMAERSVVQLRPDEIPARLADWRQTAWEAAKQCGNPWLPEILPPAAHAAPLPPAADEAWLVAALVEGARPLREALFAGGRPARVTLFVGPEGDFTPAEYAALAAAGARPFTLGPHVLRADTACVAALAVILDALRTPAA